MKPANARSFAYRVLAVLPAVVKELEPVPTGVLTE
jgi:hypothetical protein